MLTDAEKDEINKRLSHISAVRPAMKEWPIGAMVRCGLSVAVTFLTCPELGSLTHIRELIDVELANWDDRDQVVNWPNQHAQRHA